MAGCNAPEILSAQGFEVTRWKGSRPVFVLIVLPKACCRISMTQISLVQTGGLIALCLGLVITSIILDSL